MTALTITPVTDPAGLGGERIHHDAKQPPLVREIWVYAAEHAIEAIHAAWVAAPSTERRYLVLGCEQYRETAGRRFVQLNLYVEPPKDLPHIEEPPL